MTKLPGYVRIIGGKWRRKRLPCGSQVLLRPTPDRVRETLFNWLTPYLVGKRVLDLFAGTGILGLESLSRGAKEAIWVESDRNTAKQLHTILTELSLSEQSLYVTSAEHFLNQMQTPFDIIFLDPPFDQKAWKHIIPIILEKKWLAPQGWLYLETDYADEVPEWSGLILKRSLKAGQVFVRLYQFQESA